MKDSDLLNPGRMGKAASIRREVAKAISDEQCAAAKGSQTAGADLSLFLADAAAKCPNAQAAPIPASQARVNNGDSVTVKNSAGALSKAAVATVASNAITGVALPATSTIATNGDGVTIQNSAGVNITSGTAFVGSGVLNNVKLPAAAAGVVNSQKINAGTVTGSGNFATFTVANGVITGIVLSAS